MGLLTYDGEFRLPLVLAQGSPFFHSRRQGELSVFPLSETGVLGDFWGRIKGAKYRFPLQDRIWDFPGDAVAGKGLIL